jgi:hypothetical protein
MISLIGLVMEQPTYVSAAEIRRLFNEGGYLDRLVDGRLVASRKSNRHPAAPEAPVPNCTLSQILIYIDTRTGEKVAEVHQYLMPNGQLGASGKPDPKRLLHNGTLYAVRTIPAKPILGQRGRQHK